MITKVTGDKPFQVMAETFCISPSNEGYTLQFSADGTSYSDLMVVDAGGNKTVTEQAVGTYYRCIGNATEVTVTSGMDCNTGGGGSTYILPKASASTLGGVKIGDGISIDADGKISASGGGSALTYKYIMESEHYVTDEFLQAAIACGGDSIKINDLAREVVLKVDDRYFPALSARKSDSVIIFTFFEQNGVYDYRGFSYYCLSLEGDEVGKVVMWIGGDSARNEQAYIEINASGQVTQEDYGYVYKALNRTKGYYLQTFGIKYVGDNGANSFGAFTSMVYNSTENYYTATGEIVINGTLFKGVWKFGEYGCERMDFREKAPELIAQLSWDAENKVYKKMDYSKWTVEMMLQYLNGVGSYDNCASKSSLKLDLRNADNDTFAVAYPHFIFPNGKFGYVQYDSELYFTFIAPFGVDSTDMYVWKYKFVRNPDDKPTITYVASQKLI